ncbi:hypothetical protein Egran_03254 [Elaphomyces granulatus]|uniref:Pescadillo homolog n=1 Tax=Elaphomyces granulatus TaxID=519963 RepID=A0A232LXU0_9EURO|nr:hypothetical protein Egran_03254 [Elaphomyces granulatus]
MAKLRKKGTSGQAKNFITRTQAVRKLQISLPDFRRLCIFKGIYPREPRDKKKASKTSTPNTTFYYTKDIQYLLHEQLINRFREQKALSKKIARSLGRGEVGDAARLEKSLAPKLTLDHIIKERYPTFIDALRDLDDALSLLFLFSNLPSTSAVPPKTIARCQRLCHEFQHYLIATHSLRKSFISIKGIYYQATIQGQDIMWLVPYRFVQKVNSDVDYRIMATFVEFYTTLLGFINFRLYTSIGLVYPPKFDTSSDERGAELAAFRLESRGVGPVHKTIEATGGQTDGQTGRNIGDYPSHEIQEKVDSLVKLVDLGNGQEDKVIEEQEENVDTIDKFEPTAPEADALLQPELTENEVASLFSQFTFFISREAPRAPLEFILRAFGCRRIAWDAVLGDGAFTHDETDSRITHQIVDRPPLPESSLPAIPDVSYNGEGAVQKIRPPTRLPGRTYVQPQWVWDCINEGRLLRPDLYAPGAVLPPHLSPWIKLTKGAYDPRLSLAEQGTEDKDESAAEEDEEISEEETAGKINQRQISNKVPSGSESDENEEDDNSDIIDMDIAGTENEEEESNKEDDFKGFDDEEPASESEDEVEAARTQHQSELEAEAAGLSFSSFNGSATGTSTKKTASHSKRLAAQKRQEEELERQKMMMSRKKRKLLDKMLYSNKKQEEEAQKLRDKRRKIEKAAKS